MAIRITYCLLFLTLVGLTGCSSSLIQSSKSVLKSPMTLMGARSAKPVAKILCLWEAAEGMGLDEKPARGFAGQIMFFTYGDPSPIKVDGTVRIYEYADFDSTQEDPKQIHEFVFESKAWNGHRTEGTLGHSYNVFLPYTRKGSEQATCGLRVEFEDANGQKTSSPFTEIVLAGKGGQLPSRDFVKSHRTESKIFQQQTAEAAGTLGNSSKPVVQETAAERLNTLTISLPK